MSSASGRKAVTGCDVMARDVGEEGRRQAWLAALGIPLWTARHPLPGALPAPPLDYVPWVGGEPAHAVAPEAQVAPAAPQPELPHQAPVVQGAPATARMALPATPAAHSTAARLTPSAEAPRPPAPVPDIAAGDFPHFVCRVQALAPGWSAVVNLGDAPDLSALEHRLLGAIAEALGGDALALPPCEHLRWPLNRNPALDHGARAMIEWLSHALRLPPGRCIVFGAAMATHVRSAFPALAITAAPQLSELLDDPLRKRELWRSLHG